MGDLRPREREGLAQGHPQVKPELRIPNPPAQCSFQLCTRFNGRVAFLSCPVLSEQSWLCG